MKTGLVIVALALAGCSTASKPGYESITNFAPDCANEEAQVRYLNKLKQYPAHKGDVSDNKYNQTVDIQIERLRTYCREN